MPLVRHAISGRMMYSRQCCELGGCVVEPSVGGRDGHIPVANLLRGTEGMSKAVFSDHTPSSPEEITGLAVDDVYIRTAQPPVFAVSGKRRVLGFHEADRKH